MPGSRGDAAQEARIDALGEAGLELARGGSVTWHLRPDRLVVTFQQVRAAASDDSARLQAPASFQVELFTAAGHYHAAGTLRMTWLGVGARSGLMRASSGAAAPTGLDLSHQVSSAVL